MLLAVLNEVRTYYIKGILGDLTVEELDFAVLSNMELSLVRPLIYSRRVLLGPLLMIYKRLQKQKDPALRAGSILKLTINHYRAAMAS